MEFTQEEAENLIEAFKELGTKPKANTAADLKSWMESYVSTQKGGTISQQLYLGL